MKTISTTLLLLVISLHLSAQRNAVFGKVDKAELESKECSYEKDAAAEILYDYGEVNYYTNEFAITYEYNVWIRIKIYNEKALDEANISIPFSTVGNNNISKISGYTYNLSPEGQIETTELNKEAIHKQKVSESSSELVFAMPKAKAGSIIEYRYTVTIENIIKFIDWVFQNDYPVRFSKYDLSAPTSIDYVYRIYGNYKVNESSMQGTGNTKRKVFEIENLPSFKSEPYMSGKADYEQRIEFQITAFRGVQRSNTTWLGIAESLLKDEEFGLQINKTVLKTIPELESKLPKNTSNSVIIQTIYDYVQKNFKWDKYYSIYGTKNIKKTIADKEGSMSDLNLLLITLLREAGIDAHPLLISTRRHGKIKPQVPSIAQFNGVFVYAEDGGKMLIMNAADKFLPYNIIPYEVHLTNALLVHKQKTQLVLLLNLENKYNHTTVINADITENGTIKGSLKNYAGQYAKAERLKQYYADSLKFKERHFTNLHKDYSFDSITIIIPESTNSDIETKANFQKELPLESGYYLFSVNILSGLNENPFVNDQRISDIEFGYNQNYVITGSVGFSENLIPEELPKNIRMILPDSSIIIQRFFQLDGNSVAFRLSVQINKPWYFADEYPDLKAIFKEIIDIINESLVFKKKS